MRHVLLPGLIILSLLLSACGEPDGPSLLPGTPSTPGSGTTHPPGFLMFTNGQAAYTVIGQSDFVSSGSALTQSGLDTPASGKIGASGKVWVVDQFNNRVLGFNTVPSVPGPNADFVIGQSNFTSSGQGSGSNQLANPTSAHDNGVQFFVMDNGNNRILVFNTIPSSNQPSADFSIGSATPNVGGPSSCTQNTLWGPRDLFATATHLFVADDTCNRVTVYTLPITGNQPNAVLVLGQPNFTSSTAALTATGMDGAYAVWSNGTKILVADGNNNRVLVYNTLPVANGAPANLVLGQANFTSNVTGTTDHNLEGNPSGVASNGTQVFVNDSNNNRVLIWNAWPTVNGASADVVLGQPDFVSNSPTVSQSGLNFPLTMNISSQYLTIADTAANRVMVWRTQ